MKLNGIELRSVLVISTPVANFITNYSSGNLNEEVMKRINTGYYSSIISQDDLSKEYSIDFVDSVSGNLLVSDASTSHILKHTILTDHSEVSMKNIFKYEDLDAGISIKNFPIEYIGEKEIKIGILSFDDDIKYENIYGIMSRLSVRPSLFIDLLNLNELIIDPEEEAGGLVALGQAVEVPVGPNIEEMELVAHVPFLSTIRPMDEINLHTLKVVHWEAQFSFLVTSL